MKKLRTIIAALSAMCVVGALFILEFSDQKVALGKDKANVAETSKGKLKIIREYAEKRWTFNIQDGNIRFSHGNHKSRDRWFKAYYGTGYDDCGNCHNLGLLKADPVYGVVIGEGERLNTVEAIRAAKDDIFPYGIQQESCFTCHDGVTTAPADCAWCHVEGSWPLRQADMEGAGERTSAEEKEESDGDNVKEKVDRIIPAYNEDYKRDEDKIVEYKEKPWFFNIQDNSIRFSHGNHMSRNRWFRVYYGTTYKDCGTCHNLGLLSMAEGGVVLEDGEHLNTVEDIRDYEDDIYPYGIMMARCFGSCHNNQTASNACKNCHLPGSKPLIEGLTERTM
ncbi:hypothetical protein N9174_02325 [bacterium]|nr:hypothetical protein [bacterium]